MAKIIKISFQIFDYEPLSENSEKELKGGYSGMLASKINTFQSTSNNCFGGNCTRGCGDWPKNDNCNSVAGCGVIVGS